MSVNMSLQDHGPARRRHRTVESLIVRLMVCFAWAVNLLPPRMIRHCLSVMRRGSRPASLARAETARRLVVSVSANAAGPYGCLVRSLATALACRIHGEWPTWCVGVRAEPPFGAHAWVEAEGQLVSEPGNMETYRRLITIGHDRNENMMA